MAVNYDTVLPGTVKNKGQVYLTADGTAIKDVTDVAPAEGMIILSLAATQNSAISRNVTLWANDGSSSFRLGTVVLPALAGASSTPAQNLMTPNALTWIRDDISNNPVYCLQVGWKRQASLGTTMDAANDTTIVAEYGAFTKQT